MIQFAVLNRFNNIVVQVRGRGDAFYNSKFVPKSSLIKEQDRGIRKQKVGNSGDVVPINQKIKDKIKTKLSRPDRGTSKDTYLNATWRIIDIEEPPTFNYVNKPLSTCPQGDGSQNILEPPRDIVPSGDVADFPDDDTDFNLNTGGPERPITPTRQ